MKRVVLIVLLVVSILFINTSRVDSRNKNIYYDNFRYTDNVDFKDMFDYHVNLVNVGDYYEITFDVVNSTDDKYELKNISINEDSEYFNYDLVYLNGKNVNVGDVVNKNSVITLKYRVEYKKQVNKNEDIDSSFGLEYGQLFQCQISVKFDYFVVFWYNYTCN